MATEDITPPDGNDRVGNMVVGGALFLIIIIAGGLALGVLDGRTSIVEQFAPLFR